MPKPASKYLFAYSSLRKGFHQEKYAYVTKYFDLVCSGKARGIISDLGTELVATPAKDDCFIKGELFKLKNENDFSYVFGQLDDYEGLDIEEGEKPLYRREIVQVYKENGTTADAWIYWYSGDVSGKSVIDSGDILSYKKQKDI
jgi:gamma-glutamylcyclotransferase (GGCT)/AIG2-like uncharacterized protein YtfP